MDAIAAGLVKPEALLARVDDLPISEDLRASTAAWLQQRVEV